MTSNYKADKPLKAVVRRAARNRFKRFVALIKKFQRGYTQIIPYGIFLMKIHFLCSNVI